MNETINTIEELINNVWKNDVVLSKETGKKFKDDDSLQSSQSNRQNMVEKLFIKNCRALPKAWCHFDF